MIGPSLVEAGQDLLSLALTGHQFDSHPTLLAVQAPPAAGECPIPEQIRLQVRPVVATLLLMDPDSIHIGLPQFIFKLF